MTRKCKMVTGKTPGAQYSVMNIRRGTTVAYGWSLKAAMNIAKKEAKKHPNDAMVVSESRKRIVCEID